MAVPPHHFDDEPAENQPGGLLDELERRQDDVLNQLDDLDAKLSDVLKGLEPAKDPQGDLAPDRKRDLQALLDAATAEEAVHSEMPGDETTESGDSTRFDGVDEDDSDGSPDDWA